jgi:uncharacterized protein
MGRYRFGCLLFLALCVALTSRPGAERVQDIPNPRVQNGTWVADVAGMLRPETVSELNTFIDGLERDTTTEIAVVVIRTLDGTTVEAFAEDLFEKWGIGKRDRDNGLLLLWATGERRVRVEVGYGLEGMLPDGKVGAILDQYVIPRFKAGEYDRGVVEGVHALATVIRNEPLELSSPASNSYDDSGISLTTILGALGVVPAALGSLVGYRRWRRYRRRICPECRSRMTRVLEVEDDRLLDEAQRVEEKVGSVDYDVWTCPSCSHHFTLRYPKWLTSFDKCPQCRNRTRSRSEKTLVSATTSREGKVQVTESCAFCNYHHTYKRTTPRVSSSSGSSSGGSSGGGSSFGGGSSGGGGASRGY